jgi:hypothetical protein
MAKKAAKRGKTRSKKARKKAAKKSTKKAVKVVTRRKTAKARRKAAKKTTRKAAKKSASGRKTAKKTASRRKTAKKAAPGRKAVKKAVRRPKAAKKTAKTKHSVRAAKPAAPVAPIPAPPAAPKSTAPAAPKPAKPITPAAAPKAVTPTVASAAPRSSQPSRGIDVREVRRQPVAPSAQPGPESKPELKPQPKPQPKSQPSPQPQLEPTFLAGHFDPGIDRYYSMLARNTPESHRLGTLQIDRILAANPKDIVALAEKAHDIVNSWRNDVLSAETIKECQMEFVTGDPFACAHKWAQRSIDAANAQGIASPYGHWARAYTYKYQKQPNQSVADYKTALGLPTKAFIGHVGRRRKDLIVEWLEGLIYWAKREQLQKVLDKIDSDVPPGAGKLEAWINWVKCFALHLSGKFEASNALYPDHLPDDRDVNLIIAANHARLGHEDLRQLHRKLFLEKDGNANWSAAKEIERSPFADRSMRDFWYESVEKALRAPAAAPSAAPTPQST